MRILEAGVYVDESMAQRLPRLNFSANTSFTHNEQENEIALESHQYNSVRTSVNWELDLWGKNKNAYKAKIASYNESKARYRAEYLKMVSETAQTYFEILQKDRELRITKDMYKDILKRFEIYNKQYAEGMIAYWKILRQKAEIQNTEKELLDSMRARRHLENRLALLLGKTPGEFRIPSTETKPPLTIKRIPQGLPSQLLSNRPDIIAAEHRLRKSYFRLGESRAARLPSISLTGNGGIASSSLDTLLKQWSVGISPSLSFPLFDGGASKARAKTAEIQLEIEKHQYIQTVMKAFEEVENILTNIDSRIKQKKIMEQKIRGMKEVRSQTFAKFKLGLISQLEILDVERELFQTEKSLLNLHRSVLSDIIALYKALGGGWPES